MLRFLFLIFCTFVIAQETYPVPASLFNNSDSSLKGGCYRIPSLITTQQGTLIAVADQRLNNCGDLKYNDDINIVMRKSFDNGFTWTPIETVVNFPKGISTSDASMVVNQKNGDILLFFNYMDLDKSKDIYRQYITISKDDGKTWSTPKDITMQISPKNSEKDFKFITSGHATQSQDNTIYQTLVDLQKGVFIFYSKDNGNNWHLLTSPIKPADETNITVLNNGNLLLNARVKNLGFRKFYIFKPDGTLIRESIEKDLKDPACNASTISYHLGNLNILLFSNANSTKKRKNMTIKYSLNNGINWNNGKVIYPEFSAYSSLTQLKNNNIGILYEADNYNTINFSVLPINWILK